MITTLWRIAYEAAHGYFTNRLSTSAAAMAFYTMFALGPIMIFSIAVAEPFVGKLMAQEAIFNALSTVVAPEQLKGAESREIVMKFPNGEFKFTGKDYVAGFALPNFFFHVTTAYALLRHEGINIGKMDFLGGI